MRKIVVGVDGSKSSAAALRWAAAEAALHGAELEVVYVYEHNPPWMAYAVDDGMTAAQLSGMRADLAAAAQQAARHAQAVVDGMVAALPDVEATTVALEGHRAAQLLVERSKDAQLLVVGSRGRGGFTGLLLGSVSQQCIAHAHSPVAVVPHQPETD